jgi:ABC-2 type transport system permease protein
VRRLRRVVALAGTDLRLTFRDRSSFFWFFLAPIIWVYFTGLMVRAPSSSHHAGPPPGTPLVVVDEDGTALSKRFVDGLRKGGFDVTLETPAEAEKKGGSRLRIPSGLSAAFEKGDQTTAALTTAGSDRLRDMDLEVKLHKAVVGFLADEAFGEQPAGEDAVRLRAHRMRRRVIPLGYQQAVPGNLVLFLLMMTIGTGAEAMARERRDGVLRRLAATSLGRLDLIVGKLLGRTAVAGVQGAVFMLLGLVAFRIGWGASLLGLALVLGALVFCAAALSLLAGAVFRSPGAASGVSIASIILMAGLGGCMWPAEIMPESIRRLGLAFPTGWAMEGLHRIMSWGGDAQAAVVPSLALLGFGVVALLVATRCLRIEA